MLTLSYYEPKEPEDPGPICRYTGFFHFNGVVPFSKCSVNNKGFAGRFISIFINYPAGLFLTLSTENKFTYAHASRRNCSYKSSG